MYRQGDNAAPKQRQRRGNDEVALGSHKAQPMTTLEQVSNRRVLLFDGLDGVARRCSWREANSDHCRWETKSRIHERPRNHLAILFRYSRTAANFVPSILDALLHLIDQRLALVRLYEEADAL